MDLEGKSYRVFAAAYTGRKSTKAPGSLIAAEEEGLEFVCGNGETLLVTELQAPGKKRMPVSDFLRGHKVALS
jgi:methionyl-tRNA formyltransferase